jgi:hypothetical protein
VSSELKRLRREIDRVDEQLISLIARRMRLAEQIAEVKRELGLLLRDESRERKIVARAKERAKGLRVDRDLVEGLMKYLIAGTVGRQRERIQMPHVWARIQEAFGDSPAQLEVVRVLLRYGLRVMEDGEIACGEIRIPAVQLASETGVDRRTVNATARRILGDRYLREIFQNLEPIAYLRGVAGGLGLGVIEIIPDDAARPGIVKSVTEVISKSRISIRQVVADDPYLSTHPKLTIITEKPVGGAIIEALRRLPHIKSVIVY